MTSSYSISDLPFQPRLKLADGRRTIFVFAHDLVEILGISKHLASRIIKGTSKLDPLHEKLLRYELLSNLKGFSPEWYLDDGDIVSPSGFRVNETMLEQFSFGLSIVNDMSRDIKKLVLENKKLQKEVAKPKEIIVYTNDNPIPKKHLTLIK